MKKLWIRRLCAAAAAALMLTTAWAEEVPELREPAGVKLSSAKAYIGDMEKITVYNGSVIPYVEALDFEVDGAIGEVHVVVGQQVKAGDVLLTLDQEAEEKRCETLTEEIAALETEITYIKALAQIDREILNLEMERLDAQLPRDARAVALKQLEIEEFELNARKEEELAQLEMRFLCEELDGLQDKISKAAVIAPFDGRVMFVKELHPGSRVSAYAPLIYMADDTRLMVESEYISETSLGRANDLYALVGGEHVALTPQPLDSAEILAKAVSGEELTTRFDIASDAAVSAGQYAAVCFVGSRVEDALLVPYNAVYINTGGRYVYVVEDGVRSRRDVKVGQNNGYQMQILEGLEEGENVYVPD